MIRTTTTGGAVGRRAVLAGCRGGTRPAEAAMVLVTAGPAGSGA